MKTKYIATLGFTMIMASIMLTGCGTTRSCQINYNYKTETAELPVMYISGKETWRSPSAGYNIGTRNTHILQNASQLTLDEGYKYFAFHKPNPISNTNGGLMNTAEEFIKACVPSSANPFEIGQERCGWLGSGAVDEALIVLFKEKPHTIVVYDAKEVIDYLKAHDMFRDDGIEDKKTTPCKVVSKRLM
jgi:hypothetical protein